MKAIRVRAGGAQYEVVIQSGSIGLVGSLLHERLEARRAVVVADRNASRLHGASLRKGLAGAGVKILAWIDVPPGERSKSLSRAASILKAMAQARADRWTPVLAFGGGVVGDLAGFAASVYMRGAPLVHVPTTVLAQVDSAIGGKTAIDFAGTKNLVGSFHQPKLVVCDPLALRTLTRRDYRSGLVEAVKMGVTLRPDLLERMEESVDEILKSDPEVMIDVVTACVEAKGEVVSRDEKEEDVRAILNYGHTLGHALEAESLGRMRHGEAVAVGMNGAAWIGEVLGVTLPGVRSRQNALLDRLGLKLVRPGADRRVIASKLHLDKKMRNREPRFVLTLQIGGASVWPHIPQRLLREAIRRIAP